jgi:ankyrin repeat protein
MNDEQRSQVIKTIRQRRVDGMDLWHSYRDNEAEIMRAVIDGGACADATVRPRLLRSVLHEASCDGPDHLFPEVLATSRNPDTQDRDGNSPLIEAVRSDAASKVKTLLEAGCKTSTKNIAAMQAIHFVPHMAQEDQADVLQTFVRAGAGVDMKSGMGRTVLHSIAERGNVEAAKVLVDAGATCRIRTNPEDRQFTRMRASEIAGACGHLEMQSYLATEEERERVQGKIPRKPGEILPWKEQQRNRSDAPKAHVGETR